MRGARQLTAVAVAKITKPERYALPSAKQAPASGRLQELCLLQQRRALLLIGEGVTAQAWAGRGRLSGSVLRVTAFQVGVICVQTARRHGACCKRCWRGQSSPSPWRAQWSEPRD